MPTGILSMAVNAVAVLLALGAAAGPTNVKVAIEDSWLVASQGSDESLQTVRVAIWARHVFAKPELPLPMAGFQQLDDDPEEEYVVASRGPGTGPYYVIQIIDFRADGIVAWSYESRGAPRVEGGIVVLGELPEGYQGVGTNPTEQRYRLTASGLARQGR